MSLLFQIALSTQLALPMLAPLPMPLPLATLQPRSPLLTSQLTGVPQRADIALGDDPADSLLRVARERMTRGDYRAAAELFHSALRRYPSSSRLSEAMYYESFALYRAGEYAKARGSLDALRERFPVAASRGDANALRTRVCGELARQGDSGCAEEVTRVSGEAAAGPRASREPRAPSAASPAASAGGSGASRSARQPSGPCDTNGDDDAEENDTRIAALNALLQMDAERAMPILTTVLARRDRCSERLRRKAVFLVAQKQSRESANLLLATAKNDPDSEVREQAVFWLSQVRDPRAIDMLIEIVNGDGDTRMRERALFALSQHSSAAAGAALRLFAENAREPRELRERAIFSLGQREGGEQNEYLKTLYRRLDEAELKERVLFALSMRRSTENLGFVLSIAKDPKESMELRKKAIFHCGNMGVSVAQLGALYTTLGERELREQVIFALSQRHDASSIDRLMDIARSDADRELRKKAIFWLGQSRDPRATAFLAELINK
jgi:HEAT repeat protein